MPVTIATDYQGQTIRATGRNKAAAVRVLSRRLEPLGFIATRQRGDTLEGIQSPWDAFHEPPPDARVCVRTEHGIECGAPVCHCPDPARCSCGHSSFSERGNNVKTAPRRRRFAEGDTGTSGDFRDMQDDEFRDLMRAVLTEARRRGMGGEDVSADDYDDDARGELLGGSNKGPSGSRAGVSRAPSVSEAERRGMPSRVALDEKPRDPDEKKIAAYCDKFSDRFDGQLQRLSKGDVIRAYRGERKIKPGLSADDFLGTGKSSGG